MLSNPVIWPSIAETKDKIHLMTGFAYALVRIREASVTLPNVHIYPKSHLKLELSPLPQEDIFVIVDNVTAFKNWLDNK